jgi:transposase
MGAIISIDVDQDQMKTVEMVNAYKSLTFVERAFRNLKTVQLEICPVYHNIDDRICSHVFLCIWPIIYNGIENNA